MRGLGAPPLMTGDATVKTPHADYWFYWGGELQAIRSGRWKLHFPHEYRSLRGEPGKDGLPGPYVQRMTELELYDLETDIGDAECDREG